MKKLLATAALVFSLSFALASDALRLTILYTNDLHGYMLPFDYTNANYNFTRSELMADIRYQHSDSGGLARRASLIQDIRAKSANPVLLIDAGDLFARGPWGALLLGEPEIEIYNLLGYDAVCVGNNEFKALPGTEAQGILVERMRESEFPWLCANLTVGGTGVPVEGVRPFVVRRIGDLRIGILGLTSAKAASYPQTAGWTVSDPIEAAAKWAPIARRQCDVLIAVTHIGYDEDQTLAAKVDGIDAILGGDTHTFLPELETKKSPRGVDVPIVQDGAYGVRLGRLDLTLEKKKTGAWRVKDAKAELIPVDSTVPEDPRIAELLEYWIPPDDPTRAAQRIKAAVPVQ
jgi:2',3'-cyclic-nucleotide 2'-phosphodiesterase (5'-nucleotidase family)